MSMFVDQAVGVKRLLNRHFLAIVAISVLSLSGSALAAGSLVVSPSTGLSNGQTVTVSGSGMAANSTGAIVECNSDAAQPTITVAGNAVPVSCSNPLAVLATTDASGTLAAKTFTVHTGTVGPPAAGTDSSGGSAASDAAKYPCPVTSAQAAAGDSCNITFGDAGGDDVILPITFAASAGAAPATTTTPSASSPTTPSASAASPSASSSHSTLVNTGPGNTIGLFVGTVLIASVARYSYLRRRYTAPQ